MSFISVVTPLYQYSHSRYFALVSIDRHTPAEGQTKKQILNQNENNIHHLDKHPVSKASIFFFFTFQSARTHTLATASSCFPLHLPPHYSALWIRNYNYIYSPASMAPESALQFRAKRLATFTDGVKIGNGKIPKQWTLKLVDINHLADLGFYYTPTRKFPDQVTCFWCGKKEQLLEDVRKIAEFHLANSELCCYALILSYLEKFVLDSDKETFWHRLAESGRAPPSILHPHTNSSSQLRQATFKKLWKFENRKKCKVTLRTLAKAGFYYSPLDTGSDRVICMYCDCPLEEWDPDDDPLEEHKKNLFTYCYFLDTIGKEPIRIHTPEPTDTETSFTQNDSTKSRDNSVNESPMNLTIRLQQSGTPSPMIQKPTSPSEFDAYDFSIEHIDDQDLATIFHNTRKTEKPAKKYQRKGQLEAFAKKEKKERPDTGMSLVLDIRQAPEPIEGSDVDDYSMEESEHITNGTFNHISTISDSNHSTELDESTHDNQMSASRMSTTFNLTATDDQEISEYTPSNELGANDKKRKSLVIENSTKRQKSDVKPSAKAGGKPDVSEDDAGFNLDKLEQILNSPKKGRKMKVITSTVKTPPSVDIYDLSNQNLGDYDEGNLSYIENDIQSKKKKPQILNKNRAKKADTSGTKGKKKKSLQAQLDDMLKDDSDHLPKKLNSKSKNTESSMDESSDAHNVTSDQSAPCKRPLKIADTPDDFKDSSTPTKEINNVLQTSGVEKDEVEVDIGENIAIEGDSLEHSTPTKKKDVSDFDANENQSANGGADEPDQSENNNEIFANEDITGSVYEDITQNTDEANDANEDEVELVKITDGDLPEVSQQPPTEDITLQSTTQYTRTSEIFAESDKVASETDVAKTAGTAKEDNGPYKSQFDSDDLFDEILERTIARAKEKEANAEKENGEEKSVGVIAEEIGVGKTGEASDNSGEAKAETIGQKESNADKMEIDEIKEIDLDADRMELDEEEETVQKQEHTNEPDNVSNREADNIAQAPVLETEAVIEVETVDVQVEEKSKTEESDKLVDGNEVMQLKAVLEQHDETKRDEDGNALAESEKADKSSRENDLAPGLAESEETEIITASTEKSGDVGSNIAGELSSPNGSFQRVVALEEIFELPEKETTGNQNEDQAEDGDTKDEAPKNGLAEKDAGVDETIGEKASKNKVLEAEIDNEVIPTTEAAKVIPDPTIENDQTHCSPPETDNHDNQISETSKENRADQAQLEAQNHESTFDIQDDSVKDISLSPSSYQDYVKDIMTIDDDLADTLRAEAPKSVLDPEKEVLQKSDIVHSYIEDSASEITPISDLRLQSANGSDEIMEDAEEDAAESAKEDAEEDHLRTLRLSENQDQSDTQNLEESESPDVSGFHEATEHMEIDEYSSNRNAQTSPSQTGSSFHNQRTTATREFPILSPRKALASSAGHELSDTTQSSLPRLSFSDIEASTPRKDQKPQERSIAKSEKSKWEEQALHASDRKSTKYQPQFTSKFTSNVTSSVTSKFISPINLDVVTSEIETLLETIEYLAEVSATQRELHNDAEGVLTRFIAAMPEEEESMSISEWMQHNAKACGATVRDISERMIQSYEEAFDGVIKAVEAMETRD